ncbi:MAG: hypothetical protein ABL897_11015, partial [Hyphomicrobium sp.]
MSITTTYSLRKLNFVNHFAAGTSYPDITSLANGGFAVAAKYEPNALQDNLAVNLFTAASSYIGGYALQTASFLRIGEIARLDNGNLATTGAEEIGIGLDRSTHVNQPNGTLIDSIITVAGNTESQPVAALHGGASLSGFVTVTMGTGPTPLLSLEVCKPTGQRVSLVTLGVSNPHDAHVTGLNDGGFAVSWREGAVLKYAVFNDDGSARLTPQIFSNTVAGLNVVALKTGGFAIVYEFSGGLHTDLFFATFDRFGNPSGVVKNISSTPYDERDVDISVLSNGFVAVTSTNNQHGSNTDSSVSIVDPATGNVLTTLTYDGSANIEEFGSVAGLLNAQLVALAYDATQNTLTGGTMQLVRATTGDALANALVGDDAIDIMFGLGGNDILNGARNADRMAGGQGNDIYGVDNVLDVVTELAGAGSGIDTVRSSISYVLGANVENVLLLGAAAINATGNAAANTLTGNAAA